MRKAAFKRKDGPPDLEVEEEAFAEDDIFDEEMEMEPDFEDDFAPEGDLEGRIAALEAQLAEVMAILGPDAGQEPAFEEDLLDEQAPPGFEDEEEGLF